MSKLNDFSKLPNIALQDEHSVFPLSSLPHTYILIIKEKIRPL